MHGSSAHALSLVIAALALVSLAACSTRDTPPRQAGAPARVTHPGYEVYNGCGKEGNAVSERVKELNRLKNRTDAPAPTDIDSAVTLAAVGAEGDDTRRWSVEKAATVEGFVTEVKMGGVETCNCKATDRAFRDTHVELLLDPGDDEKSRRVIAEVTPRWRAIMREKGADWSTRGLRDAFLGRWVRITGWLLFDTEHEDEAEHTAPGRARNWRETAWEIHPITSIEVIARLR